MYGCMHVCVNMWVGVYVYGRISKINNATLLLLLPKKILKNMIPIPTHGTVLSRLSVFVYGIEIL